MEKYRLITDFKTQIRTTIWKHLDAMAVNYAVYSSHLKGLAPYLTDLDVYLYCDDSCMVVVCLDCCGHNNEQIYDESETLSPLIFSEDHEPRVSKVWKLVQTVRAIGNQLMIPVYGILITEAEITNTIDLYDMWGSNHVTVFDDFKRLKYRKIRVNEDRDLACRSYVDALIENPIPTSETSNSTNQPHAEEDSQTEDLDPEYEEFARMLNEFINREYDEKYGKGPTTDDQGLDRNDDDRGLDRNDDDEGLDWSDDDEGIDWNDDDAESNLDADEQDTTPEEEESFPNGVIEQNPSVSVEVEILRPIPNPREELDKLVGCNDIKQRLDELLALTSYNKMLQQFCPTIKQHVVSLHSLFLGRPGTGKTTVCKIYGSLLRQAGALSKGHVVVCDRGTFIGTLWGDEERSARQVIDMAKGGVLMIDEAYLLNSSHPHDPGKNVIQLMMNILADETQRDIAIVLCGYKEPMKKLLDLNPGLQSRLPNRFEFNDFTIGELLEITKRRVLEYGYTFNEEAWQKYVDVLSSAYQARDKETWGNARFVGNLLERIYIQHASRCVKLQTKSQSELQSITPEDIVPIEVPRPKARIGF